MISTIKKLPWYMADKITIRHRNAVFQATMQLLRLLLLAVRDKRHEALNTQLVKRLSMAAMLCPGFSVVQKDDIAYLCAIDDSRQRLFNQPRYADFWVHQHTLCPKEGIALDVLEVG